MLTITLNKEAEHMNFLKKIGYTLVATATAGFLGYNGLLLGQMTKDAAVENMADLLIEDSQTVSDFELQVMYVAKALDGEARGHEADWPHIMSAMFNRKEDARWDNTMIGVVLTPRPSGKGCEVDAMCDQLMEDLSTASGQAALAYASQALTEYAAGEFQLTHMGHSWATPAAAKGHAYFEGLTPVAEGTGHIYFADAPTRPKARPGTLSDCAPAESLRPPKGRPVVEDAVYAALVEAHK